MSKLYRSLLWSGVVAAGVAACGDDVTVQPPAPPPAATVHSISVAPNGVTVGVGTTVQMQAAVNADAGVATTVTWSVSSPATVATISASGVLTTVGAGVAAVQACSTVVTSVCGNATITISATSAAVQQVNVTPPAPFLVRPATGTASLQFSAAVIGSNNPSQVVTWSLPGTPANASISATGLLTITSAISGGTINVSACSTVVGFTNVCGFAAVTIQVPTPATVSIQSVTWVPAAGAPANCTPTGAASVPVTLTNVSCQIEVTANVNAGDVVLQRIDVLIGGQVVASQTFPGTVASNGDEASVSAPVDITLSVNTRQVKSGTTAGGSCNGFACIPVIFNGNQAISLNLYTSGAAAPLASNAIPVVMNNADAVVYPTGLASTVATPTFTTGGITFFKGSQTITGGEYIAFSRQVPTTASFTGTLCGASTTVVTGTATSGILLGGVFACAGVEGQNTVSTAVVPAFAYAAATGPDGTPITPPTFYSTRGSGFTVPINAAGTTELRWNLLLQNGAPVPLPTALTLVAVDNKAPTITIQGTGVCTAANGGKVAFNDAFDQCWINASYNLLGDVSASDAGTGLKADGVGGVTVFFLAVNGGATCTGATTVVRNATTNIAPGTAPLVETVTSDGTPEGHRFCATAEDNIGNVSAKVGPSNFVGVDVGAPNVRLAGSTAATPTFASLAITFPGVSSTPNTTIYSIAAPFVATDRWGLEALDGRSGFNQNVVAGFPANETMTRLAPAVNPAAVIACGFTNPLGTVLSDNWVRSSHIPAAAILDCGTGGPGYFTFNGFVTDRAGNVSTTITRNYAIDQYFAPVLSSIGPGAIFYTAGQPAGFFLFGSDDLEIIDVNLALTYPGMNAITATLTTVTKALASITGCARWDATLCNILAGATATDPYLFGRVDLTCSGAGTPYASCLAADATAPTTAQYNNVDTDVDLLFEDDDKNPTGVSAVAFDVASQASGTVNAGLLTAQTNDVAQQWGASADIITWKIINTVGSTVVVEHKASTSITAPYFDFVYLARADVGATTLVICSTFPNSPPTNPALTDNGINRFWTYTISKPTGTAPCAAGGSWYAVGVKAGAALVTQAVP